MTKSYYLIEHRLDDGTTWQQVSAPIHGSAADARLILAQAGVNHPDVVFRLVKRTTTTEVVDA